MSKFDGWDFNRTDSEILMKDLKWYDEYEIKCKLNRMMEVTDVLNKLMEAGFNDISGLLFSKLTETEITKYEDGRESSKVKNVYYCIKGTVRTTLSPQEKESFIKWKEDYEDIDAKYSQAKKEVKHAKRYEGYVNARRIPIASIILWLAGIILTAIPAVVIAMNSSAFFDFLLIPTPESGPTDYSQLIEQYGLPLEMFETYFPICLLGVILGVASLVVGTILALKRIKNVRHSNKNRVELEEGIEEANEKVETLRKKYVKVLDRKPGWYNPRKYSFRGEIILADGEEVLDFNEQ
jgi:hypothetical protein